MERGINKKVRVAYKHKRRIRRKSWDDGIDLAITTHGGRISGGMNAGNDNAYCAIHDKMYVADATIQFVPKA